MPELLVPETEESQNPEFVLPTEAEENGGETKKRKLPFGRRYYWSGNKYVHKVQQGKTPEETQKNINELKAKLKDMELFYATDATKATKDPDASLYIYVEDEKGNVTVEPTTDAKVGFPKNEIQDFRLWDFVHEYKEDKDGVRVAGRDDYIVLAKSAQMAAEFYLEEVHKYTIVLMDQLRRGISGPRKVEAGMLETGKTILSMLDMLNTMPQSDALNVQKVKLKEKFDSLFGANGLYKHYRNEDGSWKEPTGKQK